MRLNTLFNSVSLIVLLSVVVVSETLSSLLGNGRKSLQSCPLEKGEMISCTDESCRQCSNPEPPFPSVASRYVRNPLARAAMTKMRHDESFSRFNKSMWYTVRLSSMDQADGSKFLQLDADDATEEFLANASRKSDAVLTQLWFLAAKACLSPFMTQTSINGYFRIFRPNYT